ncbi:putative membrane protein [Colwellia psychrerythraea 34H]|uniref:Putative membrane protein n=2 Tax=Colwellia psychrerythraea TaxID=28229 RepID=Q47ZF3_COLP3|nr:putative membrane protein [Colwellia psychrerythraea 34H]
MNCESNLYNKALIYQGVGMSFRGNKFYIASFIICTILAIIVQQMRTDLFGINNLLDTFLGSAPSFLYLFGILSVIPMVLPNIKKLNKSVLIVTAGALTYEIEQYWTSMFFDLSDIIATILAALLMIFLHKIIAR